MKEAEDSLPLSCQGQCVGPPIFPPSIGPSVPGSLDSSSGTTSMSSFSILMEQLRQFWVDHFSRRFSPRRPPLRHFSSMSTFYRLDYHTRQAELGLNYGFPQAKLSDLAFIFQGGKWVRKAGDTGSLQPLNLTAFWEHPVYQGKNKELLEENNYLKLQRELLMDMLTDTTARLQLLEQKLEVDASRLATAYVWQKKMKRRDGVHLVEPMILFPR